MLKCNLTEGIVRIAVPFRYYENFSNSNFNVELKFLALQIYYLHSPLSM